MSNLIGKAIPKVSREFAEELKRTFRPITITPDISRDKIFISVGQQQIIDYVLRHSKNDKIISKDIHLDRYTKLDNDNTIQIDNTNNVNTHISVSDSIPKKSLWDIFTTRFGG